MGAGATIIQKTQLVTLEVKEGMLNQQRFNFLDQPQLRSVLKGQTVYIDAIECYTNQDMAVTQIGQAVITPAIMQKSYLTLFIDDQKDRLMMGEYVNFMPLTTLHRTQSNQTATQSPWVRDLIMFPGLNVDWSKSYVTVGTPIGGSTPYNYLFNVYYHFGPQITGNVQRGNPAGKQTRF